LVLKVIYDSANGFGDTYKGQSIFNFEDIKLAVETCRTAGNDDITILKCTSSYPAPIDEVNLVMMQRFAKDFNVKVGLSDHTLGNTVSLVATALGATVIEKHFILDKSIGGPDASFSLDEKEFTEMVTEVREAEKAIRKESYVLTEKQKAGKDFSRSLYVAEDIKEGELVTEKNVGFVRPRFGLHPKYLPKIFGKVASQDLKKGEKFKMEFV
jgi:pseudaminic acid synthase